MPLGVYPFLLFFKEIHMQTTSNPIFNGTLAIREIHDRNGAFMVGTLHTGIGDFAVKDPILDQYDEGRYDGQFQIESIYQGHYIAGGRSVTEIRARIADMVINDIDDTPPALIDVEPDPIDTDKVEAQSIEAEKPSEESIESVTTNDDESLFGHLMPLGKTLKLDATVDRKILRVQVERLGELGYEFDAKGQTWSTPSI